MTYVMSDLHGLYKPFIEMLKKISFSTDDDLYILGDICDRGYNSAELYLDIIKRNNVFCIRGNHEDMLIDTLPMSFGWLNKKLNLNIEHDSWSVELWEANGGSNTMTSMIPFTPDEIVNIYSFIKTLPYYRIVDINKSSYLLIHAGLDNYSSEKHLSEYLPSELIWESPDFDGLYYETIFEKIIVGHTPTFMMNECKEAKVYFGKGNVIAIDCGAIYKKDNGKLACIRLDDMKKFYI